ncbi:hypothetical protein BDY21DRAFT_414694, partial [Lineolata rhizophorae]
LLACCQAPLDRPVSSAAARAKSEIGSFRARAAPAVGFRPRRNGLASPGPARCLGVARYLPPRRALLAPSRPTRLYRAGNFRFSLRRCRSQRRALGPSRSKASNPFTTRSARTHRSRLRSPRLAPSRHRAARAQAPAAEPRYPVKPLSYHRLHLSPPALGGHLR